MAYYALSLGSNTQPSQLHKAQRALQCIGTTQYSHIQQFADRTGKAGFFYNQAIILNTPLNMQQLHEFCKKIELHLGRVHNLLNLLLNHPIQDYQPNIHHSKQYDWTCVPIDIDIIAYQKDHIFYPLSCRLPIPYDVIISFSKLYPKAQHWQKFST